MAFDPTEWQYQMPVTINAASVAANMPDGGESVFPVVLEIVNGGKNWEGDAANIFTRVANKANDIAFTLTDESTQLLHITPEYNATGGSEHLVSHIGGPSIASAVDTELLMWTRDDGAVSQESTPYLAADNWAGYWGLHESAAGTGTADTYQDLSDNANHGDDYVSDAGKTGKVGAGQEFDGTDDYIDLPDLAETAAGTITVWINPSTTIGAATNSGLLLNGIGSGAAGETILLRWTGASGALDFYIYDGDFQVARSTTTSWTAGTWYRIAATWDGTTMRLYVDGAEEDNTLQGSPSGATSVWRLGRCDSGANRYFFDGFIDEAGIRSAASSANWITTTYNCQNANDTFWTVGSEVAVGGVSTPINLFLGSRVLGGI